MRTVGHGCSPRRVSSIGEPAPRGRHFQPGQGREYEVRSTEYTVAGFWELSDALCPTERCTLCGPSVDFIFASTHFRKPRMGRDSIAQDAAQRDFERGCRIVETATAPQEGGRSERGGQRAQSTEYALHSAERCSGVIVRDAQQLLSARHLELIDQASCMIGGGKTSSSISAWRWITRWRRLISRTSTVARPTGVSPARIGPRHAKCCSQ